MRSHDYTIELMHIYCSYLFLFDLQAYTTTTGNRAFAECKLLCRVSKIGHSAKTFFAKCRTRQRIALGKEFFAECQALGKSAALGIG